MALDPNRVLPQVVKKVGSLSFYKGYFASTAALNAAYPTATPGDQATVGAVVYIWNPNTLQWEASGGGDPALKLTQSPDVAARNARTDLTTSGQWFFVVNASGDSRIGTGGAYFEWLGTGTTGAYVDNDFRILSRDEDLTGGEVIEDAAATIAAFAAAQGAATFLVGANIRLTGATPALLYVYKGGVRTDVNNYVGAREEGAQVNPADLAALDATRDAQVVANNAKISSFFSNVSTEADFKTIATVGLPLGIVIAWRETSSATLKAYKLEAGTDAESSPTLLRPNDYAPTTNEKVWKQADASALVDDVTIEKVSGVQRIKDKGVSTVKLNDKLANNIAVPANSHFNVFSRYEFESEIALVAPTAAPTAFTVANLTAFDTGRFSAGFTESASADHYVAVLSTEHVPLWVPTNNVLYTPPKYGQSYLKGQIVAGQEFIVHFGPQNGFQLRELKNNYTQNLKIYAAKRLGSKVVYFPTALSVNFNYGTPAAFNPYAMWFEFQGKNGAANTLTGTDVKRTGGGATWDDARLLSVGFTGNFQLRMQHFPVNSTTGGSFMIGVMNDASFDPLAATWFHEFLHQWFIVKDITSPYNNQYRRYTGITSNGTSSTEFQPGDWFELSRTGNLLELKTSSDGITFNSLASQGSVTLSDTGPNKNVVMMSNDNAGFSFPHPYYVAGATVYVPTFSTP